MAFGVAYNRLTERLERRGYHRGFLSLIVAAGVAGTLAIAGIKEPNWKRYFTYFACSGIPMIVGSIERKVKRDNQDALDIVKASL